MKHALRVAAATAAIAAFGIFAGPVTAQTPKPSYYDELVDNLDADYCVPLAEMGELIGPVRGGYPAPSSSR